MFIPIGLLLLIGLVFPVLAAEAPMDNPLSERLYLAQPRIVSQKLNATMPLDEFLVIGKTFLSSLNNPEKPPSILERIRLAAEKNGISYSWLKRIAICESNLNPNARGSFGEYGIYQFMPQTFYYFADKYNFENPDWYDTDQQIELAGKMFRNGFFYLWTCK